MWLVVCSEQGVRTTGRRRRLIVNGFRGSIARLAHPSSYASWVTPRHAGIGPPRGGLLLGQDFFDSSMFTRLSQATEEATAAGVDGVTGSSMIVRSKRTFEGCTTGCTEERTERGPLDAWPFSREAVHILTPPVPSGSMDFAEPLEKSSAWCPSLCLFSPK